MTPQIELDRIISLTLLSEFFPLDFLPSRPCFALQDNLSSPYRVPVVFSR